MKKHGKMILPNILLVLSLLLSGCGENAEEQKEITRSGENEKPQTSFTEKGEQWEQNTVKETDGDNPSGEKSEEPEESAEEGDLPPDESLFEYYDLLNAEYEKYGITSPSDDYYGIGTSAVNYYFSSKQQTFVFELGQSTWGENELVSYNVKTEELKTGLTPGGHPNTEMEWCGDIMYSRTFWNTGEKRIFVRNIDGSPVAEGGRGYIAFDGDERWENIESTGNLYTQPDGTMFFFASGYGNSCGYMISPDREKLTELPRPAAELAHGIKESRNFKIVGCWNNKVFALADDIGFCCLDTDSLTWETLDVEHIEKSGCFKTVGRYLLSDCTVFDMETKEIIVHNDNFSKNCESFARSYYGGKYNVMLNKNNRTWCFCRCASDGSDIDPKYYESYPYVEESVHKCYPLSSEYYVYCDNYGDFLRRYETGEDWEAAIRLYD